MMNLPIVTQKFTEEQLQVAMQGIVTSIQSVDTLVTGINMLGWENNVLIASLQLFEGLDSWSFFP